MKQVSDTAGGREGVGSEPAMAWPIPGSPAFWSALVGLTALALFLPAIGFAPVYDSYIQILVDDFIHQPSHLADVLTLRVMSMDVLDFNRPMNLLTLMADSLLWGKTPAGYHLTNVLLHGLTAALLFRWLYTLIGQIPPALVAALVFAAHPIQCEAVVEVGNREDILSTLFLLAGLLCATSFRPGSRDQTAASASEATRPAVLAAGAGTVLFLLLSVASKENGVAGPAALVAYWWTLRREDRRRPWLILLLTAGALVAGFIGLRFALAPKHSLIFTAAPSPIANNWLDLFLTQCRIFTAEFQRILWPSNLCADYTGYSIRHVYVPLALGCLGVLVSLQVLFSSVGRQRRLFALASLLFWFSLLPVANLIPIYCPMADRFLYMPMVAVALALAAGLAAMRSLAERPVWAYTRVWAFAGACAAAAVLAFVTWQREHVWTNAMSLWTATVECNPFSSKAWLNYGYAALDHCQAAEARDAFTRAGALAKSSNGEAFAGCALAEEALGQHEQAVQALERAVALDQRFGDPDSLTKALLLDPPNIARLKVIALRSGRKKS